MGREQITHVVLPISADKMLTCSVALSIHPGVSTKTTPSATRYARRFAQVILAVMKRSTYAKPLQRKPRKNAEAPTGFEPMTSAIPVRCSTNIEGGVIHCVIFSATCLATALRHQLLKNCTV